MSDFLMREDAPLTEKDWERLDEAVVKAARYNLACRRFIDLVGPFGAGTKVVELDSYGLEDGLFKVTGRKFLEMPLISQDFLLGWRDIEAAHQGGAGLDVGGAAAAAVVCAQQEDRLILWGDEGLGYEGLCNAAGRSKSPLGAWDNEGGAFEAVAGACGVLAAAGFYGPYSLLVGLALHAKLQQVVKGSGNMLEMELVKGLLKGGSLFQSPLLDDKKAVLVSQGAYNLELVVGQDLITAYLGPEELEHRFRVMESLALRIKHPGAICTLE